MKPPIKKPLVIQPNFCACGDHAWANLTRGYVTLVSTDDAEILTKKWHAHKSDKTFYAFRTIHIVGTGRENAVRISEYLHRIICPASMVDHKNRNTMDNRRPNLRPATRSKNAANSTLKNTGGSSAYRGVCWDASRGKWVAQINVNKRHIYLGRFAREEDAARAYDVAAAAAFGNFASLNFTQEREAA